MVDIAMILQHRMVLAKEQLQISLMSGGSII